MVETKLATPAMIAGILILMGSLGVNVVQWQADGYLPYSCDVQPEMFCHKLSKVNAQGIQSYCYYNKDAPTKYKSCSTGWNLMEVAPEEPILLPQEESSSCPSVYGFVMVHNCEQEEDYVSICSDCTENGCSACARKDEISLPGIVE